MMDKFEVETRQLVEKVRRRRLLSALSKNTNINVSGIWQWSNSIDKDMTHRRLVKINSAAKRLLDWADKQGL